MVHNHLDNQLKEGIGQQYVKHDHPVDKLFANMGQTIWQY